MMIGIRYTDGNNNTGLLKVLALLFMFMDHAGKMLFPHIPEMRMLGRIAFPLYCWCLVLGATHTRSFPKYLLRIALVGLISQPLYMVALNHALTAPNIFLSLFVALIGLWGLREKRLLSQIWAPALALVLAELLHVDYGWKGVLLVFLLWGAKESKGAIAAVMIAFCLFWGSGSSTVTSILGVKLTGLSRSPLGSLLTPFLKLQTLALLALPLMLIPMGDCFRLPKWLGYALYPLHLALLIGLEYLLNKPLNWHHLTNAWHQLSGIGMELLNTCQQFLSQL